MSFVVTQARVFDGERRLDGRHDVLIEDGTITAIDPGQRPAGHQVADGRGATLLPGLIDAHVHAQDEEALGLARGSA